MAKYATLKYFANINSPTQWYRRFYDTVYALAISNTFCHHLKNLTTIIPEDPDENVILITTDV